jgi:hypothetical protein
VPDEIAVAPQARAPAEAPLPAAERARLIAIGGLLMLLVNLGDPAFGLINIPVSFFLKNRLHLAAHELAVFRVWIAIPLFASFAFGFVRDRWSPWGLGDRGHLIVFGLLTSAIYTGAAFLDPTYGFILGGMLAATAAFQLVASAGNGLIAALGQKQAMAGQMSTLLNAANSLPIVAASLGGGVLSAMLEGQGAVAAARILFLTAAAVMAAVVLFAALRPRVLFDGEAAAAARPAGDVLQDIRRLLRHRAIYPVILIQALWQFAPAAGTVLQYHLSNTLHASDAQWGAWNAIFFGSFLPVYAVYHHLCQRIALGRLLWFGFALAVLQMVPLLFVHSATGALIAAAPMGIIGGIAQAALIDLAIRSCPSRLQGTMMMLISVSVYWVAVRFGDLFGTDIYDHHGGFVPAVIATIIVYALILPVLLLVPRRLLAQPDGATGSLPATA